MDSHRHCHQSSHNPIYHHPPPTRYRTQRVLSHPTHTTRTSIKLVSVSPTRFIHAHPSRWSFVGVNLPSSPPFDVLLCGDHGLLQLHDNDMGMPLVRSGTTNKTQKRGAGRGGRACSCMRRVELVSGATLRPVWSTYVTVMCVTVCHAFAPSCVLGDNTCSSYASLHCLYGSTCSSPSDCIRSSAEFEGYEAPPTKAVLIFLTITLAIIGVFICCLWGCLAMWDRRRLAALKARVKRRASETDENSRRHSRTASSQTRTMQLAMMPVSASFRDDNTRTGGYDDEEQKQPRVTITTTKKKTIASINGGESQLADSLLDAEHKSSTSSDESHAPRFNVSIRADGTTEVAQVVSPSTAVAPSPLPFPPPLPPLSHKKQCIRSGAKFCTAMSCLGAIVVLIIACLMYPHMPKYSVCNKEIEWGSIFRNMVHFSPLVDVDLHLSVYNPNRFHLLLNEVDARILYGTDIVGTGR